LIYIFADDTPSCDDKGKINATKIPGHTADSEEKDKSTKLEFKSDTGCSNSKVQIQAKENTTCSSSADGHALSKNDFKVYQKEGDRAYKDRKFKSALTSFEKAKKYMKYIKQGELMQLFCKIADCYLHFGRYKDVLEEMKNFHTSIEKSYQVVSIYIHVQHILTVEIPIVYSRVQLFR
jgi:hypothetical protein